MRIKKNKYKQKNCLKKIKYYQKELNEKMLFKVSKRN